MVRGGKARVDIQLPCKSCSVYTKSMQYSAHIPNTLTRNVSCQSSYVVDHTACDMCMHARDTLCVLQELVDTHIDIECVTSVQLNG